VQMILVLYALTTLDEYSVSAQFFDGACQLAGRSLRSSQVMRAMMDLLGVDREDGLQW